MAWKKKETPKHRVIDFKLVQKVRSLPCMVCASPEPNDCDHIRTRGAGGGDEITNLWSLCRMHHQERHWFGLKRFVEIYNLPITWKNGYPELDLKMESDQSNET